MNKPVDFSLKGFFGTGLLFAGGFWVVVTYLALARGGFIWPAPVFIGIGGVVLGLWACCLRYMFLWHREVRGLHFPVDKLGPDEEVCLKTRMTMSHYRSGQPHRFWETVGGKLFLTDRRLVFLAHRGQPWHYRIEINLTEVAVAESCNLFGSIAGGLRVTTTTGRRELFTFGAVRYLEADEWAAAILLARYRSDPERDWSETPPTGLGQAG